MAEKEKILGMHIVEDDDVEKVREWWKKNGLGIVAGVVLGIAGVGGFKGWEVYTENRAVAASNIFQAMLGYEVTGSTEQAMEMAFKLIDDYSATPYVDMAQLMLAKLAMDNNDQRQAVDALSVVMNSSDDPALRSVARLRLARVALDSGDLGKAEELAHTTNTGGFDSEYLELLGDIYVAQQKMAKAKEAYDKALEALAPSSVAAALLTSKRNLANGSGNN